MKSRLTFLEATGIVVGAGVGGGVMAVPYLASRGGIAAFLPIVIVAFLLNVVLNLLLTEVLIRDGRDLQIVELMRDYVFRGRVGAVISWVFFLVLGLSFIASLTAYVSGAGEVVAGLTGLPELWSRLAVYAFSALIVFFGLKSVGVSEGVGLVLLVAFAVLIVAGSLPALGRTAGTGSLVRPGGGWEATLALFGVVMYSLNAAFAVPQAVKGLGRAPRRSVRAVIAGTTINALLIVIVTLAALLVSREVTEVAVIGIGEATGRFVAVGCSLFVVAAMLTTYWSVSLALADIVRERLSWSRKLAWVAATAPTLVLIVFGLFGFVEYMQIAGGIVALLVVYVAVPMYLRARREQPLPRSAPEVEGDAAPDHHTPGDWDERRLGWLASPLVLTLFVVGMVLMAIGSFLGVGIA